MTHGLFWAAFTRAVMLRHGIAPLIQLVSLLLDGYPRATMTAFTVNKFNKQRALQGFSRQSTAVKHHVEPSVQREGDFRNNDGGLLHLSESCADRWDSQLRSAQVLVPSNGSGDTDPGECSGYWRGQLHGYKDF